MGTDVNIHFLSDSSRARRDITELQNRIGDLGVTGEKTKGQLAEIGTGLSEARQTAEREVPLIRQLAGDIGNLFKVALFDVPVGFIRETARIFGRQTPPPFIRNLQEQIQSTQTATEAAIRPIATLNTILGELEADFFTTSTATDFFTLRLQSLEPELLRVNNSLARKRREFIDLVRDGATPADTSLRQVTASIEILEGKSKDLTREIGQLQKNIAGADVETRNMQSSTEAFGGALSAIDTRFMSYQERVAAYTGTIRELPPAITAVREGFDALAPTAARVNAIFDDLNTSLVDSQREGTLLDAVTQKIIQDLQDLEGLAHVRAVIAERTDVHNANLINQAVSEGVLSLREYVEVMGDVQGAFETTDAISDRLTQSIRDQASAFDALARSAGRAATAQQGTPSHLQNELPGQVIGSGVFDEFSAQSPGDPPGALELAIDLIFQDLTGVTQGLIDEFSQLDGDIGSLASRFASFDIAGLASGNPLSLATLPFQLHDAFTFDQRQADANRPALHRQNQALFERGEFGIPPDLLALGRGQLDNAASATRTSGFGGQPLLDFLEGLQPQIGRTSLDAVANLPERIREAIQTFTDHITNQLADELSQASFDLNFAEETGGDVAGALQDVIGANTALYQAQIDSYNLQRQALGYAVGNVEELNRILNGLNNQSRLALASGPQNANQFLAANNITRGLTPGQDDQERGVVFDPNAAGRAGIDATLLQDLNLSNVQTTADAAIRTFNEAINSPIRTIQSINEAATTLEPQLQTLYDTLFAGIAGPDGIINTAAEQIDFNQLGTFEQFIERYAGLQETAIGGVNASRQRLDTLSQQIATDDVIGVFRDSILAPSQTVEGLIEAWDTNVVPSINSLYDQLFANIAGPDGFINTTDETTAFLQLGSREDFTANFRTNLLEPGINTLESIASTIEGITQDRELTTTFDGFNAAILAPAQTIEGLTSYWDENVVPTLRETYNFLREQIIGEDGLISPDENLRLIQMGLDIPFEDWAARHEDNILTPGIERLQSATAIIASITQNREVESVTELFDMALQAPGATIAGLTNFWDTTVSPVLRETYNFLREEIIGEDGLISPEELARLTQAGLDLPFTDWESSFRGDILQPGITSLQASTNIITGITNDRRLDDLFMGFNSALEAPSATVAGVTQYWIENVDPVLMETYEYERGLIIGEDGLISPSELAQLTQVGLDLPFTDWALQYKDQIFTPGITKLGGIRTQIGVITQEGTLDDILGMFNTSAMAPGATVEGLGTFWQDNVDPVLRDTYDTLRADIIGADGLTSPNELLQLIQAGLNIPFVDWASAFETDIRDPAIENLDAATAHLTSTELSTGVDTLIEGFRESAAAPGATIGALTERWNAVVVPALQALYGNLFSGIAGDDGIINTALEQADLLNLGTEDDFISGFVSDILNPVLGTISDRQSGTASALSQNQINRANFDIGGATSESGFEDQRRVLISAINAHYDAEQTRIDGLELSEGELQDLREDNQLAREQALFRAINLTNSFAEMRIQTEEQTQTAIMDLRDDALETEADRLQSIEDLNARHLDRVLGLELRFSRDLDDLRADRIDDVEDLNLEYQRDLEDLQNRFTRSLFGDAVSFSDLTADRQRQVTESTGFQRGAFDLSQGVSRDRQDLGIESGILRPGSAGSAFYRQQIESGQLTDEGLIEQLFGRQGLDDFTQLQRGTADAGTAFESGLLAIETESRDHLAHIASNLQVLQMPAPQPILPQNVAAGAGSGVTGNVDIPAAAGGAERPIIVENTVNVEATVEMDGKEVAKIVGPNIAQQKQSRRNF